METLIILTILSLSAGGYDIYRQRKQDRLDYAEYMANRMTFDASAMKSEE